MPDHVANRAKEKRGLGFLSKVVPGIYRPNAAQKTRILQLLGVSQKFKQAFDAIRLHVPAFSDIASAQDFDLIETKTTDKYLPSLPEGFFFGFTENEEMLLRVLEGKYFLCLISLHKDSIGYRFVSWQELRPLIQTKRIQYQVNLVTRKAKAAGVP